MGEPSPATVWPTREQQRGLEDFARVYEAEFDDLIAETVRVLSGHPVFGPMIRALPPEQQARQNREARARLVQAITGEWEPYDAQLRLQGAQYAAQGLPFAAWNELLRPFARVMAPRLVRAYQGEPDRLVGALTSMEDLFNHALGIIAEAYFERRELSLKKTEDELREALRVRDDFLSLAGHELRTPLAAMLLQIEGTLRLASRDPALGALATRLQRSVVSGRRMERLINELLEVTKIHAGRLHLEPEPVDLLSLARDVAARFEEAGASGPIAVGGEASLEGCWDRFWLEQVLANLVSNAVKFGEGKPVEVQLVREAGWAVLRVTDRGGGIDPAAQHRLFQRFERLAPRRAAGGFGLGLWICKQIVEASGGTIAARSRPGEGATFEVRLPLPAAGGAS
ncbi:MAG TPA: HAMP domain-containing sensor histidine kinase [Myxococcales bacterium]|nr:HAMP domain-containing sensor histidine kinase [Myxococcales bacterium]